MSTSSGFQDLRHKIWKKIVKRGCEEASTALTEMLGMPLVMKGAVVGFIPVNKISFLTGDPEQTVTGARLIFSGDVSGHMIFILPLESWEECKKLLLSQAQTTESFEMVVSAFAEMANITCSFFIVNLANVTDLTIHFTPPEVMKDMSAVVLQETLTDLSHDANELLTVINELLVIETTFSSGESEIKGYFLFLPFPSSVKTITERFLTALPDLGEEETPEIIK